MSSTHQSGTKFRARILTPDANGIEVEGNVNEGIGAVAGRAGHGKDPPKAVFHVRRVAGRGRVEGEGL